MQSIVNFGTNLQSILTDKQLKAKARVEAISGLLLDGSLSIADLIDTAKDVHGAERATCIEAIEFATRSNPEIASLECLRFVTETLLDTAPRVKWESAKVIGNIAHLYPGKLDKAIGNLLTNSEHAGTVVRWSAAFALGEIVKLRTRLNNDLIPAVEAIVRREDDNAIKKIYLAALMNSGQ